MTSKPLTINNETIIKTRKSEKSYPLSEFELEELERLVKTKEFYKSNDANIYYTCIGVVVSSFLSAIAAYYSFPNHEDRTQNWAFLIPSIIFFISFALAIYAWCKDKERKNRSLKEVNEITSYIEKIKSKFE